VGTSGLCSSEELFATKTMMQKMTWCTVAVSLCSCTTVRAFLASPGHCQKPASALITRLAAAKQQETAKSQQRFFQARRPSVESGLRYRSDDWLRNFLSIPNSFIMRRIRFHLLSNTAIAVLAAVLYKASRLFSIPMTGHTLMGGFLSLLLVFRTNSAYARFWEARGVWANCLTTCRDLALCAVAHLQPHSPVSAARLTKLLAAFPDALSYACLSGTVNLPVQVKELVPRGSTLSPAMSLILEMHKTVHRAALESPTSKANIVEAKHLTDASHQIHSLVSSLTNCEKIVRTPVPWSYSRHTSRFLTIWCGTLPFALVSQLGGVLTVLVTATVCWCLFSIEEIGHLIEQPFVGYAFDDDSVVAPLVRRGRKTQPFDIGMPVCFLAGQVRSEVLDIVASSGAT
jgi:predicted membrane chloride channel (bestrophin family)